MIPKILLKELLDDKFYETCVRSKENNCHGKITLEHALIFGGKQVQEKFAIIPVCAYHHGVNEYQDSGDLNKEYHWWIALSRATDEDLAKYSKSDWKQRLKYLNLKYGTKK